MTDNWPGATSNMTRTIGNAINTDSVGNTVSYNAYPWWGNYPPYYNYPVYVTPQAITECAGDIHIFPCPHCDLCKCGKAKKIACR